MLILLFPCKFPLKASQQIVELLEASQIRTGIQPQSIGRNTSLHDMKAIIKTWKLVISPLCHEIFFCFF